MGFCVKFHYIRLSIKTRKIIVLNSDKPDKCEFELSIEGVSTNTRFNTCRKYVEKTPTGNATRWMVGLIIV